MLLVILDIHCVSKKFPPLNSLQLCQILTDFQNFCTARPTANAGYSPPRRGPFPDYFGQTCYNRNQKWLQPVWHFEWDELGKLKGFLQLQQLITLQIAFWCLCIIRLICAPIKFTYLLTYLLTRFHETRLTAFRVILLKINGSIPAKTVPHWRR